MAAVCSFSERRDKLSRRARAERQRCTRYLPDTKPCLGHPHARVVFGGQEHDQPGIELDATGKGDLSRRSASESWVADSDLLDLVKYPRSARPKGHRAILRNDQL